MSAFFVTKKTIDHCVMASIPSAMTGDEVATLQGKTLIAMNIRALVARYPSIADSKELEDYMAAVEAYEFVEHKDAPEAQLLKSLNCWLYQCAEGKVPEEPKYQRLNKLSDDMTGALSGGRQVLQYGEYRPYVPGYEEAEWDAADPA